MLFFIILLILHMFFSKAIAKNFSDMLVFLKTITRKGGMLLILLLFFMYMCSLINASGINLELLIMQTYDISNIILIKIQGIAASINISGVYGQALITMFMIIIASFYYTVQFSKVELFKFSAYSMIIFVGGVLFLIATNAFVMFIGYELILLPTTLILDYFSKTTRSREATQFMITWTQVGALMLFMIAYVFFTPVDMFGTIILTTNAGRLVKNILILLTFFSFGTKMPIWPFYKWLPEAHVEVSTNFSIVLSGVSIKFAFLGFIKFIEILGGGDVYWICAVIAIVGAIDAALKIDTENDIKKIVAYQTVVEMHALVAYVSMDSDTFLDVSLFLFVGHCWISTINFIIVDMMSKRYHTRNVEHLYGIMAESPRLVKFIFLITFIFESIPGTLIYSIEFYVQIAGSTSTINTLLFILMQLFLVVWSKNIWWLIWGGDALHHKYMQPFTMTKSEALFIIILILQLVPTLGFTDVWFN